MLISKETSTNKLPLHFSFPMLILINWQLCKVFLVLFCFVFLLQSPF